MYGYTYVQGAGDDHELWSRGLSPHMLWSNYEKANGFIHLDCQQVDNIVDSIVAEEDQNPKDLTISEAGKFWRPEDIVKVTDTLYFGKIGRKLVLNASEIDVHFEFERIIVLDSSFVYKTDSEETQKVFTFNLDSGSKKSSKLLRKTLPSIMKVLTNVSGKVLIVCNTGEDLSVAVVICYLNYLAGNDKRTITKETIRRDLIRLMELRKVNPQRTTLNAVNAYLMS